MKAISQEILKEDHLLLYIHTPFCGTCHVARAMLEKIEALHQKDIFYEMNASFYSDFMQEEKVESVPCLYIRKDGEVKEKIYAFHSLANIYHYLYRYEPELFKEEG